MTAMSPFLLFTVSLLLFFSFPFSSSGATVDYDDRGIKIDGDRKMIISGSIHYPRSTPEMWPDLVRKAKAGGLNAIDTYVFWNAHEPQRREYSFLGNHDLVRFIKTINDEGLYVILRIGPYVCAEWNYGGFPVWLYNMPGIDMRTYNEGFMNEMKNFTTVIVDMMKQENLFASQGGPIILAQIENEYGNVMFPWGEEGKDAKKYLEWCGQTAEGYKTGIPWMMCQQEDAPNPLINTCNGFYCDKFRPNRYDKPKIWTENWTGWYKKWGMGDPHRTAEDLAFAAARFFQSGGSVMNYYMYHGGTNFGRTSGGPYITTSYDYDAPLDEYGNLNQPKWGHLKTLHELILSMEKTLLYGSYREVDYGYEDTMWASIFSYEGKSVCFFANTHTKHSRTINFENSMYTVPPWSVSILPDCHKEAYNTAKVNSQTSIWAKMDNEADDEEEPYSLKWTWKKERIVSLKNTVVDGSVLTTNELLDQKAVTNDSTDYLWYITTVELDEKNILWGKDLTLRVHTNGHVLHVFINKKHVGTQWAENDHFLFIFNKKIKLKRGKNEITLLSVTAGLRNYGYRYYQKRDGIHGPVFFIGRSKDAEDVELDISSNKWIYKVGLYGEERQLYNVSAHHVNWHSESLPTNRRFVWYKTSFPTPLGTDPVVGDLYGLGKGVAWVNGHSIGRYWTSFDANENGCNSTCDYRGPYESRKCLSNCGKPTQRWYHIPRAFLRNDEENVLILLEELGGTPALVRVQTATIGKVCAHAYEGGTLDLSCQGSRVFSEIKFASFGVPDGTCGSFTKGKCEAKNTYNIVKKACLGRGSCSFKVSEDTFGPTGCKGAIYRLAVEAIC